MSEESAQDPFARLKELLAQGVSIDDASEQIFIEDRIRLWQEGVQEKWGDDLVFFLYGGINVTEDVDIPELGIRVEAERKEGRFVFGAPEAYVCRVKIKSIDFPGYIDAVERLEQFLNAWHVVSWAKPIHYFCALFHQPNGGGITNLSSDLSNIRQFMNAASWSEDHLRVLIDRAAWWLRHSRHEFSSSGHETPAFQRYTSYWNAFECLMEVICDIVSPLFLSPAQKKQAVAEFFKLLDHVPTPEDVDTCYRAHVNPGFHARARHALIVVFGLIGEQYYDECFRKQPKQNRLYQIRNDINHGKIVEFNVEDRRRVENAQRRLWLIVLNLFFVITRLPLILDREVRSCYTCVNIGEKNQCQLGLLPDDEAYWRYVCDQYARRDKF